MFGFPGSLAGAPGQKEKLDEMRNRRHHMRTESGWCDSNSLVLVCVRRGKQTNKNRADLHSTPVHPFTGRTIDNNRPERAEICNKSESSGHETFYRFLASLCICF